MIGPAADDGRGVERGIQHRQVGEGVAGLENDVVWIAVLKTPRANTESLVLGS